MKFYPGELYHVYNRGNIRQRVFHENRNYIFFLKKMKTHLTPYCHILAWCLMPNHFHWLIKVKDFQESEQLKGIHNPRSVLITEKIKIKRGYQQKLDQKILANDSTHSDKLKYDVSQLNQSIGVMLRSYTRAINNSYKSKGSLFQQGTRSKNLNSDIELRENYALVCFLYILQNPIRAKLSKDFTGWPYSAYLDYSGLRNGTLCNKELATQLFELPKSQKEFMEFVHQSLPDQYQEHIF